MQPGTAELPGRLRGTKLPRTAANQFIMWVMTTDTNNMPLKICHRCKQHKPATLEFFYIRRDRTTEKKLALKAYCKQCEIGWSKEWNGNNRERSRTRKATWNRKRMSDPAYRKSTLEKQSARGKQHRRENLEIMRHRDKIRDAVRTSTPHGGINRRMRRALRKALGTAKNKSWPLLVGYTANELRTHLERQFLPRMGWHNMEKWHIDHIIPLANFSYTSTDSPDFKAAWALSNLRPLWSKENIKKSAKRLHLL